MEPTKCTKCMVRNALKNRRVCYQCNNPSRDFGKRANQTHKYRRICAARIAKGMCEYCERYVDKLHVDHVNGNHGDDRQENYQVLCVPCHVAKTRLKGEYKSRKEVN